MYFSDYKQHPLTTIRPTLLWEYHLTGFDYQDMRNIVVQRVIERGWPDDFFAILNLYGEQGVGEAIRKISTMNRVDMNFVNVVFGIPLTELRSRKRSNWEDEARSVGTEPATSPETAALNPEDPASPEDLAARKLNDIIHKNRINDFVDIARLSATLSLRKMITNYAARYPNSNPVMALKAMNFHQDIDFQEPIPEADFNWDNTVERLAEMTGHPDKTFEKEEE